MYMTKYHDTVDEGDCVRYSQSTHPQIASLFQWYSMYLGNDYSRMPHHAAASHAFLHTA